MMPNILTRIIRRLSLTWHVLLHGGRLPQPRERIPVISSQEIEEVRQLFPLDKFFIFGYARSGTTILARLIRVHPDVHCNWQAHFFTRRPLLRSLVNDVEVEKWLSRRSNRWNHGRDLSPVVLRVVADYILEREAKEQGAKVVGDKSPSGLMNGLAVEYLHEVYPDARLIYIVRDGRDTVLSHRFQTFIDAPQHLSRQDWRIRDDFARDAQPYFERRKSVFTERGLIQDVSNWARNVLETDELGRKLYGERYLSLRYEDLMANPMGELQRIWAFLGVDANLDGLASAVDAELNTNLDAAWQRKKAREIAEPLQKGKAGSWRDLFTERDKQLFKQFGNQVLVNWGYERDDSW